MASRAHYALLALAWGCSAPPPAPPAALTCAPNEVRPCACASGAGGTQACSPDGTSLGVCQCAAPVDLSAPVAADVSCAAGLEQCGRCVDLTSDPAHCGACGHACGEGQWCGSGVCQAGCVAGRAFCTDRCVDRTSDRAHCGDCDAACDATQACVNSHCVFTCPAGQDQCGDVCTHLASDSANCGACGQSCGQDFCDDGACVARPVPLRVRWDYPALLPAADDFDQLPIYLSHLFGSPMVNSPIQLDLACATVENHGPMALTVALSVSLNGYTTQPASQTLTVPGRSTASLCMNPVLDRTNLYALDESTLGRITSQSVFLSSNVDFDLATASLLPSSDIAWSPPSGRVSQGDMDALSVVFVTPQNSSVTALVPAVEARSVFPGGFAMGGYARSTLPRTQAIAAGSYARETLFLESGETLSVQLASVEGGAPSVALSLFTAAQYAQWLQNPTSVATQSVPGASSGATLSYTPSGSGGWYTLVLQPAAGAGPTGVRWTRSNTAEDIAEDALHAIYDELHARGIVYTDISASFYAGTQHLRRPDEVLSMRTGNCIEGSLLFASLLEQIGMEPVLVYTDAHAYVAVRAHATVPGAAPARLWPVETTLVGTNAFDTAFNVAREELAEDPLTAGYFNTVDIAAERAAGIAALPQ